MNDAERKLLDLEPKPPGRLLEELASLTARATQEPIRRPRVTLHLRSGRDLHGTVLKVKQASHGTVALIHAPGPDWDVVHVPVDAIEAVTVHDAAALDKPPEGSPPAPGRLDFRRKVAAWETSLHETIGVLIGVDLPELNEADLEPLDALIKNAMAVIDALARDQLGRQALIDKVERIRLAVGSLPAVSLSQKVLLLTTVHAYPRRMTAAVLQAAIEAAL